MGDRVVCASGCLVCAAPCRAALHVMRHYQLHGNRWLKAGVVSDNVSILAVALLQLFLHFNQNISVLDLVTVYG